MFDIGAKSALFQFNIAAIRMRAIRKSASFFRSPRACRYWVRVRSASLLLASLALA